VRRHHRAHPRARQALEGHEVLRRDLGQGALVDRDLVVRVGLGPSVAGKVLADGRHARLREAGLQRLGQRRDHVRVLVERAVADDAGLAVVHVEHGREGEVDAVGLQLARDHVAAAPRGREGLRRVAVEQAPELAHRRDRGETVLEALHPAALVVHRDDERGLPQLADRVRQLDELKGRGRSCARRG